MAHSQSSANPKAGLYFASLFFFLTLGTPFGGLTSIAVQYVLKDHLHIAPVGMAAFNAWAATPLYLGLIFGTVRDTLRSRNRDRMLMLVGAAVATASYLFLARTELSFPKLSVAAFFIVFGLAVASTAAQGLMTSVARALSLTGWYSAVWNVGVWSSDIGSFVLGGWIAARVAPAWIFVIGSAIAVTVAGYAILIPRGTLRFDEPPGDRIGHMWSRLQRLFTHRPIWLAAAIIFLFSFQPGWQTPLFYYLTGTVKISSAMYGTFLATLAAFQIPGAFLFAQASRRYSLRSLLWVGTILMILEAPMPMLIKDAVSTEVIAIVSALFFGIGCAAYWALVMRSCVTGLEASGYMLAVSIQNIASKGGDVLGSWLYETRGIGFTLIVNTLASAAIVFVLLALPAALVDPKDASFKQP